MRETRIALAGLLVVLVLTKLAGMQSLLGPVTGPRIRKPSRARLDKKSSGKPSITWPEAVDEALCFGWIDEVRKSVDEVSYTIRFTPRKPRSIWSAVNIKRVGELHLIPLCLNFCYFPVHRSQHLRVCSQLQRRV